jgi:DNA adenine methylase
MNKKLVLRPITGYPGGKRRFADKIVSKFPKESEYKCYYEPFIGMGAVFLRLQPKKAVISDLDPDVVNVWKQIKNNKNRFINELTKYPVVNKIKYEEIKNTFIKSKLNVKRAAMYVIIVAYTCGGVVRDNLKTSFMNPSKCFNNKFCKKGALDNIKNISNYMNDNDITIKGGDFKTILSRSVNSLVYLDPPYVRKKKEKHYRFNDPDIISCKFLNSLSKKNKFVLSNSTHFLNGKRQSLKKFNIVTFKNYTIIGRLRGTRSFLVELLVYN